MIQVCEQCGARIADDRIEPICDRCGIAGPWPWGYAKLFGLAIALAGLVTLGLRHFR